MQRVRQDINLEFVNDPAKIDEVVEKTSIIQSLSLVFQLDESLVERR